MLHPFVVNVLYNYEVKLVTKTNKEYKAIQSY